MSGSYDAVQRRELEQALGNDGPLRCPVCQTGLTRQLVEPTAQVSYVRHRVWVLCPGCRRTASLDVRRP